MYKFTALAALSALSYSIGGYFMKLSAGLTQFRPTLLVFTFFVVGDLPPNRGDARRADVCHVHRSLGIRGHQRARPERVPSEGKVVRLSSSPELLWFWQESFFSEWERRNPRKLKSFARKGVRHGRY